jgi:hypothetical protein
MKKIGLLAMMIGLLIIGAGLISSSLADDTDAATYCYFSANSIDVMVKVWHADKRGNKGYRIWEGIIRKGDRKLIRTFDGRIRYSTSTDLDKPPVY